MDTKSAKRSKDDTFPGSIPKRTFCLCDTSAGEEKKTGSCPMDRVDKMNSTQHSILSITSDAFKPYKNNIII
jgi:hypothetical protein